MSKKVKIPKVKNRRRKELISKLADKISVAMKEYAKPLSERKLEKELKKRDTVNLKSSKKHPKH